jgi:eukaryotic-like serine/threonine-protein kinase
VAKESLMRHLVIWPRTHYTASDSSANAFVLGGSQSTIDQRTMRTGVFAGGVKVSEQRWAKIEQYFAESSELAAAERGPFLDRVCAGDKALRDELEQLLTAHDASGMLDTAPDVVSPLEFAPSLALGASLGPWQIQRLLARGGMGEVYLVQRTQAGFTQQGALKLLRFEAVAELERFHTERRILASLEHPGIARLLDGGGAPDGRPYTVMEFVAGRSLIDYCQVNLTDLSGRLELFKQVCDAVSFAHRNLIIHRDLKPDNIFVDDHGQVKLLDFGIAKLLDAAAATRGSDTTMAPFTPDYAAPEQLSGGAITTATDVYALGAIFYELLCGVRASRKSGLPSVQAMNLLLDRAAPQLSKTARDNQDSPVPARQLAGDLDAITAKCLRQKSTDRYPTVEALQLDLTRYQIGEPVSARQGAKLYVFRRFLHRNRWLVAGVTALIMTLTAGLIGTLWQAQLARAQAARATAVMGFLEGLFSGADPALAKGQAITAAELLDRGAGRVDVEFATQPQLRAQLKQTIGRLYMKIGVMDKARTQLSDALNLTPRDKSSAALRFWRLVDLAKVDLALSTTDHGLEQLAQANTLIASVGADEHATIALAGLSAQLLHQRGDDELAIAQAKQAFEWADGALGEQHPGTQEAALAYANLLGAAGHDREALPLLENVVKQRAQMLGEDDPLTLTAQSNLADVLPDVDQLPKATALAQHVLNQRRKILGDLHPDTAASYLQVGDTLYGAGQYERAGVPMNQAIEILRKLPATDSNLLATAISENAVNDYFQGHMDAAEKGYRECITLWTARYGPDHRDVLGTQLSLAQILRRKGQLAEAISLIKHVVEVRNRSPGNAPERINALRFYGDALSANGDHAGAIVQLAEAVRLALQTYGEDHEMPQQTRVLLGNAYLQAGESQKAADVTTLALAVLQKLHPTGHPDVARTQGYLAKIELRLGHAERAVELATLQYSFVAKQFSDAGNPRVAAAQGLLGECQLAAGERGHGKQLLSAAINVLEKSQFDHQQLSAWRSLLKSSN